MHISKKIIQIMAIIILLLSSCDQMREFGILTGEGTPSNTPTSTSQNSIEPQKTSTILQPAQPTSNEIMAPTKEISDQIQDTPTQAVPTTSSVATLAFINLGNLFIVDLPGGAPVQLTNSGDIQSFTWGPTSNELITYLGHSLCFVSLDGSSAKECVDLGLNDLQATIERHITLSPDGRYAALWNTFNPWDEEAIGWIVIDITGSGETWQVLDPVDWGAQLAPDNDPGGVTGQALFLPDATLIGTFTHRWLCAGTTGCHYQLFSFDFANRALIPFDNKPAEGFSEGMGIVLSDDGRLLLNHGTFHAGCEAYLTFVDVFDLKTHTRRIYNLEQVAVNGLALAPNNQQAIIARNAGCSTENQTQWAQSCGLSPGFDVYNMQLWNLVDEQRVDLTPGTQPDWSPDGNLLAFRSCLDTQQDGSWVPSGEQKPSIYTYSFTDQSITPISIGQLPQWKP
ncbi:hypothetical protein ACFLZW_07565 [Chloroflexota bacterium]